MEQRIQVLIVDDRSRSRDGLKALLSTVRQGSAEPSTKSHSEAWPEVEVVGEAANGREAVRLVEECGPDVVVMDARMPGMDGLEATRLIKDRLPEVKVVALTLYGSYRAIAAKVGADAFLIKGCSSEELLQAISDNGQEQER